VDVRIVTATHRSLVDLVREGRFREDLYYRLNVVPLFVPPLRERKEDILPLVRHFIARYAPDRVIKIAPSAGRALLDFGWPGNVRQLENEVRRLLVFVEREITVSDLALSVPRREDRDGPLSLRERVDALEKSLVVAALDEHHGNRTKMAEALGVSRQGLLKMMRRLGITAAQAS
jgi:transcriptional regulator with PAS, ATPase and Fis domain